MSGNGPSSTTTQNIPEWVQQAGQNTYGKALDFYNQGFTPPPANRVAPFSATQQNVFDRLSSYTPTNVTQPALDLIGKATQPVTAGNVMDQTGPLGSIQSWMNPFTQNAIQPAIDAIIKQSQTAGKNIDSNAISAHAYGDARNGIMQGENQYQTQKAIGDTASTAYAGAYNSAISQREQAIQDQMNLALGNRSADMAGAGAMVNTATSGQNNFLAQMQALLGAGGLQQQQVQSQLDVPFQNWQMQTQDSYDRLASLVSTLSAQPYTRSSTTTQNSGSSGLLGGLGALLGGAGSLASAFIPMMM